MIYMDGVYVIQERLHPDGFDDLPTIPQVIPALERHADNV